MPLIFCVLIIAIVIGICIYYHNRKKLKLPKQIEVVKALIEVLNKTKIQIHFCEYEADEGISCIADPLECNIFGLTKFNGEALNERYEDELVLFNPDSNQFIDLELVTDHQLLPKIISDELLNFKSSKFKLMEFGDNDDQPKRFVNIQTGLWVGEVLNGNKELIRGEMEALESWQGLLDCSEQLQFVIVQWLKDVEVSDNGDNFGIVIN